MDTVISASSLIPAGIVVAAIGIAIAYGIKEGKTNARIDALEKADEGLAKKVDAVVFVLEELKRANQPTSERLIAIEIEQRQQRQLLENINEFLLNNAKLP